MRMQERAHQPIPGRFDQPHVARIHHHLFQDIYPWAGQLRTAPRDWPMVKMGPDVAAVRAGGRRVTETRHAYFTAREIPEAATVVLDRIAAKENLRGLDRGASVDELTTVWLRINFVHPLPRGQHPDPVRVLPATVRRSRLHPLDTERFTAVRKAGTEKTRWSETFASNSCGGDSSTCRPVTPA